MDDFERYLNKQLKRPEFKAEWNTLEQEYKAIQSMLDKENQQHTEKQ